MHRGDGHRKWHRHLPLRVHNATCLAPLSQESYFKTGSKQKMKPGESAELVQLRKKASSMSRDFQAGAAAGVWFAECRQPPLVRQDGDMAVMEGNSLICSVFNAC